MLRLLIGTLVVASASMSSAAPRCLDLSKKQAEKAVTIAKIAVAKGSPLIFQSSREAGLVIPTGIWAQAKKKRNGRASYRVKIDGREVDISLVYVARSPKDRSAYNLGWMAGCRPAPNKPTTIRNF